MTTAQTGSRISAKGRTMAQRSYTLTDRLALYFKSRPNRWTDATALEVVAGRQGWRTRCSELRRAPHFMTIQNSIRRWPSGRKRSMYRYVPPQPEQGAQLDLLGEVKL
jgi:hypothetical protein